MQTKPELIEWPSNVKRPTLHQVYTTAMRRYGSDKLGKTISRAVLAIYAHEVIYAGRERTRGDRAAARFCGMSQETLTSTWAHHRTNPGSRYRSYAIMNELIQQCD